MCKMSVFGNLWSQNFMDFNPKKTTYQILHEVPIGSQQYRRMLKCFYFWILVIAKFSLIADITCATSQSWKIKLKNHWVQLPKLKRIKILMIQNHSHVCCVHDAAAVLILLLFMNQESCCNHIYPPPPRRGRKYT
jgi:hypothetical protein